MHCREWHLKEPKFAKFPGGGAFPQTPLEAQTPALKMTSQKIKEPPSTKSTLRACVLQ